nr:cysteine-rich receptor-like protein kinase [Tanacetum cinerariifolium]
MYYKTFDSGTLPRGCNTSFITLIPKVQSPLVVSDFRPISLIGAQYKIVAKILANRLARVIDSIISQEQSAFIKHRQILDGPLMVNEVIQWCKRKKSKLMVFKIDFEKAFDSISWEFLFRVLHFMGFRNKWILWISGCITSATTSILINGSPTSEFNIERGLRQGDPLSPFLFIIAMEGLHGYPSIETWLELRVGIRLLKSSPNAYQIGELPSSPLELETLRANFFWGNGVNSHKIHWISWNVALASKEKGGLGFGRLFALNQALILKWCWRFLNNSNDLWARFIVAIHGHNTASTSFFSHIKIKGVWSRIVGSIN